MIVDRRHPRRSPDLRRFGVVPGSFTSRALAVVSERAQVLVRYPPPGSRQDFLSALERLGAGLRLSGRAKAVSALQPVAVHLSCAYATWVRVFGEPIEVESRGERASATEFHFWIHRCPDGLLACTGHLFDREGGEKWLVLAQIQLI